MLDSIFYLPAFARRVANQSGETYNIKFVREVSGAILKMNLGKEILRSMGKTGTYEFLKHYEKDKGIHFDQLLTVKQFDAKMKCTVADLRPGAPFNIRVDITNTGFMPWIKEHDFRVTIRNEREKFSLKNAADFIQQPIVFGDTLSVVLQGAAPNDHGSAEVRIALITPFKDGRQTIIEQPVLLKW